MKYILVVDDHPIVLEGIQSVLSRKGFKILKATTADQAMHIVENAEHLDMVVADLSLKEGTDGLDLIERIRNAGIQKPTIIYTMHEELWNIATLMRAEVDGIVLKGDNIHELILAIEKVAEGGTYMSQAFSKCRQEVMKTSGILSAKDIEVMRRLSKGENNKEIAKFMEISEKTVEYHRGNILRKLCAKTMFEATKRAIQLGIISCLTLAALPAEAKGPEPTAVDLGLSVKWADRNLGADSPMSAGGFYAFGEIFTKADYDWKTYSHCSEGNLFLQHDFGTECISGTECDAARVNLRGGWRMPTVKECEELVASTSFETVVKEGQYPAIVFTAANGNSISFPVAGYMSLDRVVYENLECPYWTGDLYGEGGEEDGFVYYFNSPFYLAITNRPNYPPAVYEGSGQLGFQIRPVLDPTSAVEAIPDGSGSAVTEVFTLSGMPAGSDISVLPPGIYILRHADGSISKLMKRN